MIKCNPCRASLQPHRKGLKYITLMASLRLEGGIYESYY